MTTKTVHALFILHPAFVLRDQFGFQSAQLTYLRRARRWLDSGTTPGPRDAATDPLPDHALLDPTYGQVIKYLQHCIDTESPLSVDTENAGKYIRLVGLMRFTDEHYCAIHLRRQYGALGFTHTQTEQIVTLLDKAFRVCPLWFHNGQAYDSPELESAGFDIKAMFYSGGDTLIMQRHAYVEAPANLQYCGITYADMPAWKHITKINKNDDTNREDK